MEQTGGVANRPALTCQNAGSSLCRDAYIAAAVMSLGPDTALHIILTPAQRTLSSLSGPTRMAKRPQTTLQLFGSTLAKPPQKVRRQISRWQVSAVQPILDAHGGSQHAPQQMDKCKLLLGAERGSRLADQVQSTAGGCSIHKHVSRARSGPRYSRVCMRHQSAVHHLSGCSYRAQWPAPHALSFGHSSLRARSCRRVLSGTCWGAACAVAQSRHCASERCRPGRRDARLAAGGRSGPWRHHVGAAKTAQGACGGRLQGMAQALVTRPSRKLACPDVVTVLCMMHE